MALCAFAALISVSSVGFRSRRYIGSGGEVSAAEGMYMFWSVCMSCPVVACLCSSWGMRCVVRDSEASGSMSCRRRTQVGFVDSPPLIRHILGATVIGLVTQHAL